MGSIFATGLSEVFITGLDRAGISPAMAERGSARYPTIGAWTASQVLQTAVVGAAAPQIPGCYVVAGLAANIAVVVHKIPIMTWGIGNLAGSPVERREDLSNVLGLWGHSLADDGLVELVKSVGMSGGVEGAKIVISRWVDGLKISAAAADRSRSAKAMAERITGVAQRSMPTSLAGAMAASGVLSMAGHPGGDVAARHALSPNDRELIRQMVEKIVSRIRQLGTVRSARLGGSAVVAGLNMWIMLGIAREARSYYANKTV